MIKLGLKNFLQKKHNLVAIRIAMLSLLIIMTIFIFLLLGELDRLSQDLELAISDSDSQLEFYRSFLPLRRWHVNEPTIAASGVLVALMDERGDKFLLEKDSDLSLPIASITKLMTAIIAIEKYDLDDELIVSEKAFLKDAHRQNNLYPGERYKVRELLYANLLESNNTAAQVLAEGRTLLNYNRTAENFIWRMNEKAQLLGMKKTYFSNPTGLDPLNSRATINRSSPRDLLILTNYLMNYPFVWEILATREHDLQTSDGLFKYRMENTNEFLGRDYLLKGGKTGTTIMAGESLLVLFERETDYLLVVILGSNNRFRETTTLLAWIEEAYHWKVI